jgi:alpha-galactosidase
MAMLDDFTLNILCNAEVIEVDQDALGRQAQPIVQTEQALVLAKPMEDGSLAVGLFNLDEVAAPITVTWEQLGIKGKQRVRDLWRQKDLGVSQDKYETQVTRHGVAMLRLFAGK